MLKLHFERVGHKLLIQIKFFASLVVLSSSWHMDGLSFLKNILTRLKVKQCEGSWGFLWFASHLVLSATQRKWHDKTQPQSLWFSQTEMASLIALLRIILRCRTQFLHFHAWLTPNLEMNSAKMPKNASVVVVLLSSPK